MYNSVKTSDDFRFLLDYSPALVAFFSTSGCNVCSVLIPKVGKLVSENFPEIKLVYIDNERLPGIAISENVLVSPTVIVYFEGKECIRKMRTFSLEELKIEIFRYYSILFA